MQVYVISGNIPELGSWVPTQSPILSREVGGAEDHGAHGIFKADIDLPLSQTGREIEFKVRPLSFFTQRALVDRCPVACST